MLVSTIWFFDPSVARRYYFFNEENCIPSKWFITICLCIYLELKQYLQIQYYFWWEEHYFWLFKKLCAIDAKIVFTCLYYLWLLAFLQLKTFDDKSIGIIVKVDNIMLISESGSLHGHYGSQSWRASCQLGFSSSLDCGSVTRFIAHSPYVAFKCDVNEK